jgi:hypothetical protein
VPTALGNLFHFSRHRGAGLLATARYTRADSPTLSTSIRAAGFSHRL